MKRIVWLILASSTFAFAQVQPVAVASEPVEVCDCCEPSGGCDMPDCAPPPAAAPAVSVDRPATTHIVKARRDVRQVVPERVKFYASLVESTDREVWSCRPVIPAPAASPPLFQAHCSFLI